MSFTVKEKREGSGGIKKNGTSIVFTERVIYTVISTVRTATKAQVLAATGLPIVGISVSSTGATCIGMDANRNGKNPSVWEVTCEYSTGQAEQEQDPGNISNDPITWLPIWSGSIETIEEVALYSAGKKPVPILNSAGNRFGEPIMRRRSIAVNKFSQFENKTTTLKTILDRNETVNLNAVTTTRFGTFPAKSLLLLVDSYEYGFFGGYECWKIDYTCKYKDLKVPHVSNGTYREAGSVLSENDILGWKGVYLDHGWFDKSGIPCKDKQGRYCDALLSQGLQKAWPSSGVLVPDYLVWDEFTPISFSFIRLRA